MIITGNYPVQGAYVPESGAKSGRSEKAETHARAERRDSFEASGKAAAGLEFLSSLKEKIPGTAFFLGTVSYGQTYGNSSDNNFVVHPKYLEKLSDPEEQKSFEESVRALNDFSNRFRRSQAAQGREVVSEGWFCDENGNLGGWTVTRKTDARSHLQEMREYADKINEQKAEKKKEEEKLQVSKKTVSFTRSDNKLSLLVTVKK